MRVDLLGEAAQQPARSPGATARQDSCAPAARSIAASASAAVVCSICLTGCSVAGLITV